jgi:multicomponent Na+:H+ antiporter subunit G
MEMAFDVLAWLCTLAGLFFMLTGSVGVLRMPDVFTRLHAAGMTDTMGAGFLLAGMAVATVEGMLHGEAGYGFVLVRLVLTYAFLLFTSPIATHALARAGLAGGVEPWTADGEGEA